MTIKHSKQKVIIALVVLVVGVGLAAAMSKKGSAPTSPVVVAPVQKLSGNNMDGTAVEPVFDKQQYSLDNPTSIWVVVNKIRPLPANYTPTDLVSISGGQMRSEAATQLTALIAAAAKDGVSLRGISSYRSYNTQKSLYNAYVAKDGQAQADTYSARPGHSEHQTGLAADLGNTSGSCDLDACFGSTEGGKWVATHSHEYGFVIRYASDKTANTGYQYEPWHIRYVGKDLAGELNNKKQTMEEFFNLPASTGY